MSARRRQETIARFSIPIEEGDIGSTDRQVTASQTSAATPSQRATRRSTRSTQVVLDESFEDDRDHDYVMTADQDDDDFIDDEDDDGSIRTQSKKSKSKAKAKGKKKATQPTRVSPPDGHFDGVNPRVMLISLKAGALGLNLTVANNVYL